MKAISWIKPFFLAGLVVCSIQAFADPTLSDNEITNKVKMKISEDPMLRHSQMNVNINTDHQVVSFSGVVSSESEASTLVELAQSTVDVKDVNTTDLKVKDSKQPLSDTFLTAKVKGKFLKEKLFGDKEVSAWTIKVETNNGVVYLTGTADNKEQVENAVKLAKAVSDVKQVKFRITVKKGDRVANYEMKNY